MSTITDNNSDDHSVIVYNHPDWKVHPDEKKRNIEFKYGRYIFEKAIGYGGFGVVVKALDTYTSKNVAIKISSNEIIGKNELEVFQSFWGKDGFPQLIDFWHEETITFIVTELFGINLKCWAEIKKFDFSISEVFSLISEMIIAVKAVHSEGYLHNDIKLANFVFDNNWKLRLIDFGLASRYKDENGVMHHQKFMVARRGTPAYISSALFSQSRPSPGRKDDLESVALCGWELLNKIVPYSDITDLIDNKDEKKEMLVALKRNDFSGVKSIFDNSPQALKNFVQAVRRMEFGEEPNYSRMLSLFKSRIQLDEKTRRCLPKKLEKTYKKLPEANKKLLLKFEVSEKPANTKDQSQQTL